MVEHAMEAGGVMLDQFTHAYVEETRAAFERLRTGLPDEVAKDLCDVTEESVAVAGACWLCLQQGARVTNKMQGFVRYCKVLKVL